MENITINKEGEFKNETISSVPLGINNIILNNKKFDLKKEEVNNIKPMLSGNSNTIIIPDGKKVKIKPMLSKKVPSSTFSMMANPRRNIGGVSSNEGSEEETSNNTDNSEIDEILSNNSNNKYNSNDEEEYTNDDYSSIASGKIKNQNQNNNDENSEYESEEYDDNDDDEESEKVQKKEKQKTYEEIQREKQELLFNLERLQKQGYPPSKRYSMASSYEDMKFEHDRLKKQRDVEKSIKFSRKILMAVVSGIEFLNGKFDPLDVKLEGWSENIMENVSDYDEVFEELHQKYGESVKMAPELKLLGMLAGSGFMFHLTNSLFKSASPKLSDILKQNPDIMRNISEAAAKNMGNTINEQFGQNDPIGNLMKGGINQKVNQQRNNGPVGPSPFAGLAKTPPASQQRMNGPVGIDDLLNELNDNTEMSVSSAESVTIKSSAKRTKAGKKGSIQLDLR